jgi:orotidine-5'-phosphate decarboxylase
MDTATPLHPPQTKTVDAQPASSRRPDPADRLIVALDFPSADLALGLVDRLEGSCRWFKVGMELYYAAGNQVLDQLRERGFDVFLDLKLHDIPNTVAGAVQTVAGAGASLLTIHAGGGKAMMQAAAKAADRPGAPRLLAVTVLTSMDAAELEAVGVAGDAGLVEPQVLRLARLARAAGINGLVCSPLEVAAVRKAMGPDALLVVPGIRSAAAAGSDDQSRVATAADAIAAGASMLVVGRPITQASDPAQAATAILDQIPPAE